MSEQPKRQRITVPQLLARKGNGPKITVLTAYDYPTAKIFDESGIDALLVGDSVGTVIQGRENTLSVTMDQMVYHTEMVSRAAQFALVVADLPFLSYQVHTTEAVRNAGRLIQQGGAHAVKLEGGTRQKRTLRAIVRADIPVMGHIGLTPQSYHKLGGYRVQRDEDRLLEDARVIAEAGAFALVLECIPAELAQQITESVGIPTIGIGAGPGCDGQVLVWTDALGLTGDFPAKFVHRFVETGPLFAEGARRFAEAVRSGSYPDLGHAYR